MTFQPSQASFGADAASSGASPLDYNQLLATYGPTLATLLAGGKDARERLALLQARIANYQRLRTTPPFNVVPGRAWYDAEIAKMKAILPALQAQAAETSGVAQAKLNVAGLTQGALVGVIAMTAAMTTLLFAVAWRTTRSAPPRTA